MFCCASKWKEQAFANHPICFTDLVMHGMLSITLMDLGWNTLDIMCGGTWLTPAGPECFLMIHDNTEEILVVLLRQLISFTAGAAIVSNCDPWLRFSSLEQMNKNPKWGEELHSLDWVDLGSTPREVALPLIKIWGLSPFSSNIGAVTSIRYMIGRTWTGELIMSISLVEKPASYSFERLRLYLIKWCMWLHIFSFYCHLLLLFD